MLALKAQFRAEMGSSAHGVRSPSGATIGAAVAPRPAAYSDVANSAVRDSQKDSHEIESLRAEVGQLRRDLEQLVEQVRRTEEGLRDIRDSLGG